MAKVSRRNSRQTARNPKPRIVLGRIRESRLLETRLCDLPVRIEGTWLEEPIAILAEELAERGLRFKPHFWLSDEWFSPGDIPGVALPFYLAHPRLTRLERKMMGEAEGGTMKECLKILRHEIGHAIQHAYQIQRRRKWQQHFGRSSQPYPHYYEPRPRSKKYVQHLNLFYAQSHPDEDFAETFAVWFQPRAQWRKKYKGWPALKKIEYVDELMGELADVRPEVRSKRQVDPVSRLRKTLGEHYEYKRNRYLLERPGIYDDDLRELFSDAARHKNKELASAFLRRHRSEIRKLLARWTSDYQVAVDQVMSDMIARARSYRS